MIRRRSAPRRGRQENKKYRAWLIVHGRCAVCGVIGCDPCHTENGGMRMKGPDSSCAPLCRKHHREFDSGRARFEAKYVIDMCAVAERWYRMYQRIHEMKGQNEK